MAEAGAPIRVIAAVRIRCVIHPSSSGGRWGCASGAATTHAAEEFHRNQKNLGAAHGALDAEVVGVTVRVMATREEIEGDIARCALGDRDAFGRLYEATSAKLYGICLRVLKDRTMAEDALQEAYVKIWHAADRYAVNGLSPISWMAVIARNAAIDRQRARSRRREDGGDAIPDMRETRADPEQSAIAGSDAARIVACLGELGDPQAAAVRGAYLDGKTYAELAAVAGVPVNTMRTWLRRSLIALRECMGR